MDTDTTPGFPGIFGDYEAATAPIRGIATAGYALCFGFSGQLATFVDWQYPPDWIKEYQTTVCSAFDPVAVWTIVHIGAIRWSEIRLPDPQNVMQRAHGFGLRFGAAFSAHSPQGKSMLSVARSDRELTDAEMSSLGAHFQRLLAFVDCHSGLTAGEIDVLRHTGELGLGYREIARRLGISEPAVKKRAANTRRKLGARTLAQAVLIARNRGIL